MSNAILISKRKINLLNIKVERKIAYELLTQECTLSKTTTYFCPRRFTLASLLAAEVQHDQLSCKKKIFKVYLLLFKYRKAIFRFTCKISLEENIFLNVFGSSTTRMFKVVIYPQWTYFQK